MTHSNKIKNIVAIIIALKIIFVMILISYISKSPNYQKITTSQSVTLNANQSNGTSSTIDIPSCH